MSVVTAISLCALLVPALAGASRVEPAVGAVPPAAAVSPEAVGEASLTPEAARNVDVVGEGADDLYSPEFGDSTPDATQIQRELDEDRRERERLEKAEAAAIDGPAFVLPPAARLGLASPLRHFVFDHQTRFEGLLAGGTLESVTPTIDAFAGATDLSGIDLRALQAEYDIPILVDQTGVQPPELHPTVVQYIRFFQTSGRKWYRKWLERSHRWIAFMQPILAEEGVPLDLVYLSMIESGFSPYAYSWAKASGFWQFISETGRRYGLRDDYWVDERRDPVLATRAAARYLKDLHDEFGDWYVAWASYNAGEGKLRRVIRETGTRNFWQIQSYRNALRQETKHYVPKLIAAAIIAKHPERFGFTDIVPEGPFVHDTVEVADATELKVVAEAAGVTVDEVQSLNMGLRRWCTPPARDGRGYRIRLPGGAGTRFASNYQGSLAERRLTFRHHKVGKAESLQTIAKKYGQEAAAIVELNGIKSAKAIRSGMDLIIPISIQVADNFPDKPGVWSEGRGKTRKVRGGTHASSGRASGRSYYVRGGDTLGSIARRFGVAVDALRRWNDLPRRGNLQIGQQLIVSPPSSRKGRRG